MGQSSTNLNRRQLISGGGAAAAAIALSSCAGSGDADGEWDEEYDVVCVGSGAAGATAAAVADGEGAKTILIEKMPVPGGTTAKSSGVVFAFDNFVLKEQGIADPKPDALKYMVRYGFPREYDPASPTLGLDETRYGVIEAFYDNGASAVDRLRELGVTQFKQFRMFAMDKPAEDYGGHLPENKVPAGRAIEPAQGSGQVGGGHSLAAQLAAYLESRNVPVMLETRVTKIVQNGEGRVVGVEVDQKGTKIRIRAKRGVIFGSGGYSHNADLCGLHQESVYGTCSLPGSTGDFLNLAEEVGAKMGNLGLAWLTQVILGEALQTRGVGWTVFMPPGDSMILVNKYGKRVVNEKRDYNGRTRAHFTYDPSREEYSNHLLFLLFDERSRDAYGGSFPFPLKKEEQPFMLEGATWDELFAKIDTQLAGWTGKTGGARLSREFAANAKRTIADFNGYAREGVDHEFNRGGYAYDRDWHQLFSPRRSDTAQPENTYPNPTMHPFSNTGPYYAFVLAPGTLDTCGGPQINASAQIVSVNGEPIPGLYGAGNCISAPTGQGYLGAGGTIGPAVTFGYIAGKTAANT